MLGGVRFGSVLGIGGTFSLLYSMDSQKENRNMHNVLYTKVGIVFGIGIVVGIKLQN